MKKYFILIIFILLLPLALTAQKSVIPDCRIWKPASFCAVPEGARRFSITKADTLRQITIDCKKLDEQSCTGVWLKLHRHYGRKFELKSGFKNITLQRIDGSKVHPVAVWWNAFGESGSGKAVYLSSAFTTNSLIMKYGLHRTADLIMIFPQAFPGDKIIIDGYVEAEILNLFR
ncbi:MAG: hypothetical protein V2A54_14835 [Bacteroidota bacterium]